MKKSKQRKSNKTFIVTILVLFIISIIATLFYPSLKNSPSNKNKNNNSQYKTYISKDLAISFEYPPNWYVTDTKSELVITNYRYNPHLAYTPNQNEIEITINEIVLCSNSLDQDLIMWGCGESNQLPNKIVEKTEMQFASGTLFSYIISYPQNKQQQKMYFLAKDERILRIVTKPDSPKLQKEFIKLLKSITFAKSDT